MAKAAKSRTGRRKAANASRPDAGRILEETIALAEEVGWDRVRLRIVAQRLGVTLQEIHAHYRDLDQVADAWFAQAWDAMLAPPPPGFETLPPNERLFLVLWRWFDALSAHRRVALDMIGGKIYLSHPHHWIPLIFNLSRTIHWLRDASGLDATGRRRQVEEIGLTLLFLATLGVWSRDGSEGQERTQSFLRRRLANAGRMIERLFPASRAG